MNNLLYPERLRDNNVNGSVIKIEIFLKGNVAKRAYSIFKYMKLKRYDKKKLPI